MKTYQIPYLFILLLMFNCATTSSVIFDYDIDEDFNQHNTFVICEDDLIAKNTRFPQQDNSKIRDLLSEEVTLKLESFGLHVDMNNPDLQAGFRLVITEETTDFRDCTDEGEFLYWEKCTIKTISHTTETLILYVSNLKKNQIIWQASIPCDMNKSKSRLKSHINELVNTLYETYPNTIKPID
ncbi:DUF4136 domain-containing protein [Psychroserpens sp. MEBiC05023]